MKKQRQTPIEDPIRHAEQHFGAAFLERRTIAPWERQIARHTTAEFAHIGKGYARHCGPTAITNLLLTLHHRHPFLPRPVDVREIFAQVSRIGKRTLAYWNMDLFGHYGGTYDILTGKYIRDCLRTFHAEVTVSAAWLPTRRRLLQALEEEKLLYLQLMRNPIYGNHHLLCYGYTILRDLHSGNEVIYLLLSDGWNNTPRTLPLSMLGLCHYFAIC